MSKAEFLSQLELKLAAMPLHEKEIALLSYKKIIENADDENAVLSTLGTPSDIASEVLSNYVKMTADIDDSHPEQLDASNVEISTREAKFSTVSDIKGGGTQEAITTFPEKAIPKEPPVAVHATTQHDVSALSQASALPPTASATIQVTPPAASSTIPKQKKSLPMWLVIVLIFLSPIIIGIIVGLGGGLLGVAAGVISIVVAFIVSGITFVGIGVASVIIAVMVIFQDFRLTLTAAGSGFIFFGAGLLILNFMRFIVNKIFVGGSITFGKIAGGNQVDATKSEKLSGEESS